MKSIRVHICSWIASKWGGSLQGKDGKQKQRATKRQKQIIIKSVASRRSCARDIKIQWNFAPVFTISLQGNTNVKMGWEILGWKITLLDIGIDCLYCRKVDRNFEFKPQAKLAVKISKLLYISVSKFDLLTTMEHEPY